MTICIIIAYININILMRQSIFSRFHYTDEQKQLNLPRLLHNASKTQQNSYINYE